MFHSYVGLLEGNGSTYIKHQYTIYHIPNRFAFTTGYPSSNVDPDCLVDPEVSQKGATPIAGWLMEHSVRMENVFEFFLASFFF